MKQEQFGLLQMIIRRDQPLANDHLEWPATCKWSSEGTSLLQMIIRIERPLQIIIQKGPASCKWSFRWAGLLQMVLLANSPPKEPTSCKWSSGSAGILRMILRRDWPLNNNNNQGDGRGVTSRVTRGDGTKGGEEGKGEGGEEEGKLSRTGRTDRRHRWCYKRSSWTEKNTRRKINRMDADQCTVCKILWKAEHVVQEK